MPAILGGCSRPRDGARITSERVRLFRASHYDRKGDDAIPTWSWSIVGLVAIGLVPALWLLDRLGLWLEDRGWLFYRHKKPTSSPVSSLVSLQQIIDPGVRHVVQVGHERRSETDKGVARDRLLACLRACLTASPVNPEAVRLYLAQAELEGLDWRVLYAEAAEGLTGDLAPIPEDVAPYN
jgi:hypothetical protein